MTEIEKKIQEAKNERQNIKNDIAEIEPIAIEKMTMLRVREAELRAIESFIDQLNDLKNKIE